MAIFDIGTQTPIASAVVPAGTGATLLSGFRIVPVTAFTLDPGEYIIGGEQSGGIDAFGFCPAPLDGILCTSGLSSIWSVTHLGERESVEGRGFVMPDIDNSADALAGIFGPSFGAIEPARVPVPATLLLLASSVAGLAGATRFRSRRRA